MPWISIAKTVARNPPSKTEIDQIIEYRRRNAKVKFYADENFPQLAIEIVSANGFQILTAQQARMRGHPDENHAAFALKHKRILLTCDRDYLDERRFPLIHCPVIVVCDFGGGSSREILSTFRCLRGMARYPQFYDKWTKLDARRDCWINHSRYLNGTTSRERYRLSAGQLEVWEE